MADWGRLAPGAERQYMRVEQLNKIKPFSQEKRRFKTRKMNEPK